MRRQMHLALLLRPRIQPTGVTSPLIVWRECVSCRVVLMWFVRDLQLEPGEVDERYDFFRKCFTLEAAEARKRTRLYDEDEDE